MPPLTAKFYPSLARLAPLATAWDALWQRTASAAPTSRFAAWKLLTEHFSEPRSHAAWIVWHGDEPVLALPLARRTGPLRLPVVDLPTNAWTTGTRLLYDPAADLESAARVLVGALALHRQPLWMLDSVEPDQPGWQALGRAWQQAGWRCQQRTRYFTGLIDTSTSWSDYLASRSRSMRRDLKRKEARLAGAGAIAFHRPRQVASGDVPGLVERLLAVEDRGWKGAAGSSVARCPGALAYFHALAQLLAYTNEWDASWLELDGTAIASQFGFRHQGTYWCLKIGYDERFAEFSPGLLLMSRVVQSSCEDAQCRRIHLVGPLIEATGRWATSTLPIDRWVLAGPGLGAQMLFAFRQWLGRGRQTEPLPPDYGRPLTTGPAGNTPSGWPELPLPRTDEPACASGHS